MSGRQLLPKNGKVLLQMANLERFRVRSLLVKSSKLNIGKNATGGIESGYANTDSLSKKAFSGQNYWNAHNISRGRSYKYAHNSGSSKFGSDDSSEYGNL